MKIKIIIFALACLMISSAAFAHCPSAYKEEKVCMMLDDNLVYVYDNKLEHNGPYKDFTKSQVLGFKSAKGEKLDYSKIARGIYKINSTKQESVLIQVSLNKKIQEIKVSHEK